MLLTTVLMLCYLVTSSVGTTKFSLIPEHIQTSCIWIFLHWRDRIRITEWSNSYQALCLDTYPNEHVYKTAFYNLWHYISTLEKPIRISSMLRQFSREMTKHWWMCPKRCDIEIMVFLSEKLFVNIIEVIEDMDDASIVCNTFIHRLSIRLPINITRGRPLHLMHEIVSRIRFNSSVDITSLRRMFWMGLQEMHETRNKYNRYTQFACYCLNAVVNMCSGHHLAVHWLRRQLKQLWKALISVTFIDDFLSIPALCQYHQHSRCPFIHRQMMDDFTASDVLFDDKT